MTGSNDRNNEDDQEEGVFDRASSTASGYLDRIFSSCSDDPKGSIHRAWGVSLIFVILYFIVSMFEMANLQAKGGSKALVLAAVWTGIIHLALGVVGTFVLKRFPTSFSVGFFLGALVCLANQNLILFGTFFGYGYGNPLTNHVFANVSFTLFLILAFFGLLLFHFKARIVVAPIDAKGFGTSSSAGATSPASRDYQKYEDSEGG